jgi:hypothetical protein
MLVAGAVKCVETARIWDAPTGRPIGEPLKGNKDSVWTAAYSPGSQLTAETPQNDSRQRGEHFPPKMLISHVRSDTRRAPGPRRFRFLKERRMNMRMLTIAAAALLGDDFPCLRSHRHRSNH